MTTLQDLSHYLEELFSTSEFSDYCPNGVQVEGKTQIGKIAFAVSASVATIKEAIKLKADALIVHHGIFWNKDPLVVTGPKKEKLQLLLSHEISLLAYHLPLDAHQEVGNNWRAAKELGLENLKAFDVGVKGTFSSIKVEEFKQKLESYYGHIAHCALGGKSEVNSAAIMSGGSHRYIDRAALEGVDCFVTGSFDEPVWDIAHEKGINFFALGHYATERVGVLALMEKMEKDLKAECFFIDLFNPF